MQNMTPVHRNMKRLIIIFAYLAIFFLLGAFFYYTFRAKPTCSDKIQNQGETGVDCGGPCGKCDVLPKIEDIQTIEKAIVPGEPGKYDALVKIENPNSQFGAANVSYSFNLLDGDGKIISKNEGTTFVLPAETKYILAFNIPSEQKPASLDFKISSFEWSKFTEYSEPNILVYAKEFNLMSGGSPGFAELKAKTRNQSGYDFRQISAVAVIRDGSGQAVAINQTSFNDVRVNEEREISFRWSNPFQIDPVSARIEIDPEVNVFDNENYMKQHGAPGQYKSYNTNSQQ
jgi:hypothetical protein